jgi:hypothetical protein
MTWRILFGESLKSEENATSPQSADVPAEGSASQAMVTEPDEAYQKILFENDLYVWSLLLFKRENF